MLLNNRKNVGFVKSFGMESERTKRISGIHI